MIVENVRDLLRGTGVSYAIRASWFRAGPRALLLRRTVSGRPLEQVGRSALCGDLGQPDDDRRCRGPSEHQGKRCVPGERIARRFPVASAFVRLIEEQRGTARRGVARTGGDGRPCEPATATAPW